ncbi:MAG: DUF2202 domain-containing protein [Bryobacteraceae bacterium]
MKTAILLALTTFGVALAQRGPGPGTGQTTTAITAEERNRLLFMREEEKLARDVYRFLGEKWNLRIFHNIASSEENHFQQVGALLTRYGIADPAKAPAGEFTDARLAALYQELITKGSASVKDALEVGVLIEKTDIADIEKSLAITVHWDIRRVFTNLISASYNHLDSFETVLEIIVAMQS